MYTEKLVEINSCELKSQDDWKYKITTYEDVTDVEYFEKDFTDGKIKSKETFSIPSCCDIQLCEKIIEMRKAFKE